MNTTMLLETLKPWLAQGTRDFLRFVGMYLLSKGILTSNADVSTLVGAGMALSGLLWGWFTTSGMNDLTAFAKKVTGSVTAAAAKAAIKASAPATPVAPVVAKAAAVAMAIVFSMAFLGHASAAELKFKAPAVTGNPLKDLRTDLGIPENVGVSVNADGTLKCDFNVFLILSPKNLEKVVKQCVVDADSVIVKDAQAALTSAQSFTQPTSNGTSGTGATGDLPAIACLAPGLEILKAGIPIKAKDAVAAVPATATTAAIPAQPAVAAYDPGTLTLFQKFREFNLKGGPTACQNWVNGAVAGVKQAVVGAAVGSIAQ